MNETIIAAIEQHAPAWTAISQFIGANPELGHEEWQSSAKLKEALVGHGFRIESPVLGLPTAFIATYSAAKPGPVIAFLSEYDALPELGHACGHHLIGVMSAAAAAGLKSVIDEFGGTIRVYGTPAEETKGAKVTMAAEGLFDDVDVAMMAHPYHSYEKSGSSMAMDALEFEFYGKAAHAAASPHEGINALDGVLLLFQSIGALRQQLRSDARIHGIITAGGLAPNIIPDYAAAQFYVRAGDRPYTDEVVNKVLRCAEGAALQAGCSMKWNNYEYSYDELITNQALSETFTKTLIALGIDETAIHTGKDHGSLDLGNVSRHCPAIHPYIQVVDEVHHLHTPEFRDLAMLPRAYEGMILGAKALALTAFDVVNHPTLLDAIRAEFQSRVGRREAK